MDKEENPKFDDIMRANFSKEEIARHEAIAKFYESKPEVKVTKQEDDDDEQDLAERIYHASQDPGIVDYLMFGDVSLDELLARIQSDYDLPKEAAQRVVDDVIYPTHEVVDYDDEA